MKQIYTKEKKTELVAKGEERLGLKFFYTPEIVAPVIVSVVQPIVVKIEWSHEVNCMCEVCFNVRLDRLVASSQKSLNDMKSSLARRVEAVTAAIVDENPYMQPFQAAVINVATIPEYKGSR